MAIITEVQEEEGDQQLPTTSARPTDGDAAGIEEALYPLLVSRGARGLLEVVVDFIRRRSDGFKSDSAYRELVAVLSAAKKEEDSAASSAAAAAEEGNVGEKRPREKEESPVKPAPAPSSAPAASSSKKESEFGAGQEERKASVAANADSDGKNLRGEACLSFSLLGVLRIGF